MSICACDQKVEFRRAPPGPLADWWFGGLEKLVHILIIFRCYQLPGSLSPKLQQVWSVDVKWRTSEYGLAGPSPLSNELTLIENSTLNDGPHDGIVDICFPSLMLISSCRSSQRTVSWKAHVSSPVGRLLNWNFLILLEWKG